jgi:hypothetical protein
MLWESISHSACSADPVAVVPYPRTAAASRHAWRTKRSVDDKQCEERRTLDGGNRIGMSEGNVVGAIALFIEETPPTVGCRPYRFDMDWFRPVAEGGW